MATSRTTGVSQLQTKEKHLHDQIRKWNTKQSRDITRQAVTSYGRTYTHAHVGNIVSQITSLEICNDVLASWVWRHCVLD